MLLTRAFIPEDIQWIIKGWDFASNIYEYLPVRESGIDLPIIHDFEFSLTNSMLGSLEINYDSTIANCYSIFIVLILITIFHIYIWILKWFMSKWKIFIDEFKIAKLFSIIVHKIFEILTFDYYIRNMLEASQFILISSVYEIYKLNTESDLRIVSLSIAILMVVWFIILLWLVNFLIFFKYELNEDRHNKLGEFFLGLKSNRKSRFYVTMLLLRRFTFIVLLITLVSIPSRQLIEILMFLQILYTIWIIFIRPYKEFK